MFLFSGTDLLAMKVPRASTGCFADFWIVGENDLDATIAGAETTRLR